MLRQTFATLAASAALLGATAAQAGTHWSIGINLPAAGVVVTDGRYVEPAPVYYEPAPVVYAPAPRYVEREVYYEPVPRVVYAEHYRHCDHHHWDDRRWDDRRWEHERRERQEHWDRDDYGPRRGR